VLVPQVQQLAPSVGDALGGYWVSISGTNFLTAQSVTFGNAPAPSYKVVSNTQIAAQSPAWLGAVGGTSGPESVPIQVHTLLGVSAATPASSFTYVVRDSGAGSSIGLNVRHSSYVPSNVGVASQHAWTSQETNVVRRVSDGTRMFGISGEADATGFVQPWLNAYDASNDARLWGHVNPAPSAVYAAHPVALAYDHNRVIVLSNGAPSELDVFDADTGALVRSRPLGTPYTGGPAVGATSLVAAGGFIFVSAGGDVTAFTAATGQPIWHHQFYDGLSNDGIAFDAGSLFVSTQDRLYRASALTGAILWTSDEPSPVGQNYPVVGAGQVVIGNDGTPSTFYDEVTGATRYQDDPDESATAVGDRVSVRVVREPLTSDGRIQSGLQGVDNGSHQVLWTHIGQGVFGDPLIIGTDVYAAGCTIGICVLDLETGAVKTVIPTQAADGSPLTVSYMTADARHLFVYTNEGLFAYTA